MAGFSSWISFAFVIYTNESSKIILPRFSFMSALGVLQWEWFPSTSFFIKKITVLRPLIPLLASFQYILCYIFYFNLIPLCFLQIADMLAAGDFWYCAPNCDHSPCCIVGKSVEHYCIQNWGLYDDGNDLVERVIKVVLRGILADWWWCWNQVTDKISGEDFNTKLLVLWWWLVL